MDVLIDFQEKSCVFIAIPIVAVKRCYVHLKILLERMVFLHEFVEIRVLNTDMA